MTTPDRAQAADTSPHELRIERLLARRRSVVAWCDRHLMAIHVLSRFMSDAPGVVDAAVSEVLSDPAEPAAVHTPGKDPSPAHLPAMRDRCPDMAASPFDRVELALHLVGDRSCDGDSGHPLREQHSATAADHRHGPD